MTSSPKIAEQPSREGEVARAREALAAACETAGLRASAQSLRAGHWPAVGSAPSIRAIIAFATPKPTEQPETVEGEALARKFHETYERLAPSFGYETRSETKQFDPSTPNGKLMIAVCSSLASHPTPAGAAMPDDAVEREHRCSICGGKSFTAVDVRQFDGTYAPGPERRCLECKTTFTMQAFAALATNAPEVKL